MSVKTVSCFLFVLVTQAKPCFGVVSWGWLVCAWLRGGHSPRQNFSV